MYNELQKKSITKKQNSSICQKHNLIKKKMFELQNIDNIFHIIKYI